MLPDAPLRVVHSGRPFTDAELLPMNLARHVVEIGHFFRSLIHKIVATDFCPPWYGSPHLLDLTRY